MRLHDFRLVARGLRRRPFAAIAASAMLSSGLLAVLVIAGLSSALLFRPISSTHGDSLRRVAAVDRQGRMTSRLSFPELQVVRERVSASALITSANLQPVVLRVDRTDLQTMAEVIDGSYFAATGTTPILGRTLGPDDDRADAERVAVISEPLWRTRFGGSPSVLGQSIGLNGTVFVIVGVAAGLGSSSFLGASVDAWLPIAHADAVLNRGWRTDISSRWFSSYAIPVSSLPELEARLAAAAADLARLYPDPWRDRRLQTASGTMLVGGQRTSLTTLAAFLAGLSLLILAVAAANVGGVLLARAAAERRHMAIHLSLGSGTAAIVRRLLLEGAIYGACAGAIAIGLYAWTRTWFEEMTLLPTLTLRVTLPFDVTVAALVVLVGAATGALLAMGPALWAARLVPAAVLRDDARSVGGRSLARARRVLVSAQVALSLALVVGAALFTKSLGAMNAVDVGFSRDGLIAIDFDLEPSGPAASQLPVLAREALTRVRSIPGITHAAMSSRAPVDVSTPGMDVRKADASSGIIGDVSFYLVTPTYFETLGLPIVAGRTFTETEADQNADVVIVNEALARQLWPVDGALDQRLYDVAQAKTLRVVGVAKNSKYRSLAEGQRPHLYRPTGPMLGLSLIGRTAANPSEALGAIQQTLDAVGPGLVGFFPRTFEHHLAIDLLPTRAAARAATVLGLLALLLSAVGLYGLIAWFVELRRSEIGVRLALGATRRDVRALIVGQTLATAAPGVLLGLLLAAGVSVAARTTMFGLQPFEPSALVMGIVALVLVVASASYLPARRATAIDPATILRQ